MEVQMLTTTTSTAVISILKSLFARHGIPSILVSDNGPQYSSREMQEFAALYGFQHVTSSPHYPQSNGMAERAVKTAKNLLEKSADPHMALLSYRTTPLPWCGRSPAELLMGSQDA
jgi:transposase InsO family protein